MRSQEITGGFIITEHYKGDVIGFHWFETLKEAEEFSDAMDKIHFDSVHILSEVIEPDAIF